MRIILLIKAANCIQQSFFIEMFEGMQPFPGMC